MWGAICLRATTKPPYLEDGLYCPMREGSPYNKDAFPK